MLEFKKTTTERANSLKTIGTVASFVGQGGTYELASAKNFKGTVDADGNKILKKVSIRLTNKEGIPLYVTCSAPVGAYLRESSSSEELKERVAELGSLPILKLPQVERDENSPNFGKPIMITNEKGELEPLILYSISFAGGTDMSATRVAVTDAMIKKEIASRAISFEDLIAL
jgi:hypothetical protein